MFKRHTDFEKIELIRSYQDQHFTTSTEVEDLLEETLAPERG